MVPWQDFQISWNSKKVGTQADFIASLIEYRHQRDQLIEKFQSHPFRLNLEISASILSKHLDKPFTMLTIGNPADDSSVLVRVQTANILVDSLGLIEKKGQPNTINQTLKTLADEGTGALLYMEPRRADPNLPADSKSPSLNQPNMDFRDYGIGAQILVALGLKS